MIGLYGRQSQGIFINVLNVTTASRCACNSATTRQPSKDLSEKRILDSHSYCLEHVKKHDRENYLAALCIKDAKIRKAVVTLRAFNVELSLIRDSTTNSDRAKLRLHFWSKLVEEIIRRNNEQDSNIDKLNAYYNYTPIAKELLDLFYLIDMDEKLQQFLQDLIGARISSKVLGYKPFESMRELELYCSKSNSSIYHMSSEIALQLHNVWHRNKNMTSAMSSTAENLGIAQGLSNIIRGIPYNSTKNCCYVPKDLLNEHQLTSRDFISKNLDGKKVRGIVEAMSIRCQKLVNDSYMDSSYVPNFFGQIFLPRVAIQSSLNKLKKCNYNICDPLLGRRDNLLPVNLWMASKYFRAPIF